MRGNMKYLSLNSDPLAIHHRNTTIITIVTRLDGWRAAASYTCIPLSITPRANVIQCLAPNYGDLADRMVVCKVKEGIIVRVRNK